MSYFAAFWASFGFIFLRALQQRNVAFDNYWWILPTSMLMAATEFIVIYNIASQHGYNVTLVLVVGSGSGLGSILAAVLHKRFIKR